MQRLLAQQHSILTRDFSQATSGSPTQIPYRKEMEAAFGEDFSDVKSYLGRGSNLESLNANAATSGERVAFAGSSPDKKQVAHELTHVVQQRRSGDPQVKSPLSPVDDASEQEAERVSASAAAGDRVSVSAASSSVIHRDIKDKKLPVPLGNFEIDMTKEESKGFWAGETGSITFTPNDKAPDCKSIRFVQAARAFDMDTKKETDWSKYDLAGLEKKANLNKMQTSASDHTHVTGSGETLKSIAEIHYGEASRFTEIFSANKKTLALTMKTADGDKNLPENLSLTIPKAVVGGFFIDHSTRTFSPRTAKRDPLVPPDYMLRYEYSKDVMQHGSKAGTAIVPAIMTDRPGGPDHTLYTFETTARCDDTRAIYGTIHWSFEGNADAGKVTKETHSVTAGVSDTFRAALTEFDKFYKNPPTGP
jgi:nucleoid-associated protein YgaU